MGEGYSTLFFYWKASWLSCEFLQCLRIKTWHCEFLGSGKAAGGRSISRSPMNDEMVPQGGSFLNLNSENF